MATNFTRRQGEVFKTTIELLDSDKCNIKLASVGVTPIYHAYFAGTATKTLSAANGGGIANVDFKFQLKEAETITSGRGSNTTTEIGHFKVEAYIPADNDEQGGDLTTVTSVHELEDKVFDGTNYYTCGLTNCTVNTIPLVDGVDGWVLTTLGAIDFTAPDSTLEMEAGDWDYEIRWSEEVNPISNDQVRVIVSGTLTIEARVTNLGSTPGVFNYTSPPLEP